MPSLNNFFFFLFFVLSSEPYKFLLHGGFARRPAPPVLALDQIEIVSVGTMFCYLGQFETVRTGTGVDIKHYNLC